MKPLDESAGNSAEAERLTSCGNTSSGQRAFELDALRGLAVLMMILHHLIFDLRYLLDLDVFAFQEKWWFDTLLRPVFLFIFLGVSGVCCSFSRSNARRGFRLSLVALLLTAVTMTVWRLGGPDIVIYFNILHLLAIGTLLYAGLDRAFGRKPERFYVVLLALAAIVLWTGSILPGLPRPQGYWLLPLGILPAGSVNMGDYMPLLPWLGFFLIGAIIGKLAYASCVSRFPNTPASVIRSVTPLTWIGRRALLVYVLHQPILLAVLFGLRALGAF